MTPTATPSKTRPNNVRAVFWGCVIQRRSFRRRIGAGGVLRQRADSGADSTNYNVAVSASVVNTTPTSIMFAVSGNQLMLNWPADHTGGRLQAQTNSLSVGIGANWVDVANAETTNRVIIPINPVSGNVFYRMVYP
jgi:hypothetical protein